MHVVLRGFSLLSLVALPLWACSSGPSGSSGALDAGPNLDAGEADSGPVTPRDAARADAAPALKYFGTPFEIALGHNAGEKPVEIHTLATSDGTNVYVAYSATAQAGENLGVYVTAFDLNGARKFAPVQVSDGDANETDTAIAVRGDTLLVAWTASSDQARVRWRSLRTDGTSKGTVHNGPELKYQGKALAASQLNPWVSTTASGFTLGGAWGVEGINNFQAAGVALTPTGSPAGEVWLWGSAPADMQDGLRIAGAKATWLSAPDSGRARLLSAERGSPSPTTLGPEATGADTDGLFVVYNDYAKRTHLRKWDATADLASWSNFGSLVSVGSNAGGGVVLGVQGSSSTPGALHALQFGTGGATLAEEAMATSGAGISTQSAYDVKLVWVGLNKYFVAYQEPTADKGWLAKGVFLRFPDGM